MLVSIYVKPDPGLFSTKSSNTIIPYPCPYTTPYLGEELQLSTEAPRAVVRPADRLVPLEADLVDQQVREVLRPQSDLVEVLPDPPLGKVCRESEVRFVSSLKVCLWRVSEAVTT